MQDSTRKARDPCITLWEPQAYFPTPVVERVYGYLCLARAKRGIFMYVLAEMDFLLFSPFFSRWYFSPGRGLKKLHWPRHDPPRSDSSIGKTWSEWWVPFFYWFFTLFFGGNRPKWQSFLPRRAKAPRKVHRDGCIYKTTKKFRAFMKPEAALFRRLALRLFCFFKTYRMRFQPDTCSLFDEIDPKWNSRCFPAFDAMQVCLGDF